VAMSAESGIMESLHAHSHRMAAGDLVPQATRDMVLGQIGLVVCQMHEGRIDADDFKAMARDAAQAAVAAHVAACGGGAMSPKAGRTEAVLDRLRPAWWPMAVLGIVAVIFPAVRPLLLAAGKLLLAP